MIHEILIRYSPYWIPFSILLEYLKRDHNRDTLKIELKMKEECGGVEVDWENSKVKIKS